MADVTYNTSAFPSLVRTLSKLTARSTDSCVLPLIIMGYKERDPAERSLWDMVHKIGVVLEKVGVRLGSGGVPVEIWIGTVTK